MIFGYYIIIAAELLIALKTISWICDKAMEHKANKERADLMEEARRKVAESTPAPRKESYYTHTHTDARIVGW